MIVGSLGQNIYNLGFFVAAFYPHFRSNGLLDKDDSTINGQGWNSPNCLRTSCDDNP
jgi:hypothetical protein